MGVYTIEVSHYVSVLESATTYIEADDDLTACEKALARADGGTLNFKRAISDDGEDSAWATRIVKRPAKTEVA